jgi:hypothetical protein
MEDSRLRRSNELLAIDACGTMRVVYVQYEYVIEGAGEYKWIIAGPDLYEFYNVTHWSYLPLPPIEE